MLDITKKETYRMLSNKIKEDRGVFESGLRSLELYCKLEFTGILIGKVVRYGDLVQIKPINSSDNWTECYIQEPKRLGYCMNPLILNHFFPVFTKLKKDGTASKVSIGMVYDNVLTFFTKWEIRKVSNV